MTKTWLMLFICEKGDTKIVQELIPGSTKTESMEPTGYAGWKILEVPLMTTWSDMATSADKTM